MHTRLHFTTIVMAFLATAFAISPCAAKPAVTVKATAKSTQTGKNEPDKGKAATKSTKAADRRSVKVRDFSETDPLKAHWKGHNGDAIDITDSGEKSYGQCGSVPVAFPETSELWLDKPVTLIAENLPDSAGALILSKISYEIFIPAAAKGRIETALLLKDKDGVYYSCASRKPLVPGEWNKVAFDLSGSSRDVTPRGHAGGWSLFRLSTIRHIGFSFWADEPFTGNVLLDNISTWPQSAPVSPAPLRLVGLDAPTRGEQFACHVISFDLNRDFLNPFSQEEIKIDAIFTSPEGKTFTIPAFYYQDFIREKVEPADRYIPAGRPRFCVRFTPKTAGAYTYHIKAAYNNPLTPKAGAETFESPRYTLDITQKTHPGFIRVSKTDNRYFEYENGDFFFPIGHNFRSPIDLRDWKMVLKRVEKNAPKPVDRGLKVYEEYLPKMAINGENTVEIWMASWWLGLEWTAKWKGYQGVGKYNLEHAWKLDQIVDMCAKNGLKIHLVIDNHGKAAKSPQHDHEWEFSPYNILSGSGGFLRKPEELFTNKRAKAFYRNKLRYIAARWGHSPDIFAFELWSELDLIGSVKGRHLKNVYGRPEIRAWHKEMSSYLNSLDQGKRPITTHYSGNYKIIDNQMCKMPEISYMACDAYRAPKEALVDLLMRTDNHSKQFNKPYIVTEFGGDWNAGTWPELEGDLHTGLWASWHSNAAGSALFWWYEHINRRNLYREFKSLAAFTKGEDKRRGKGKAKLQRMSAELVGQNKLGALGISDGTTCYLWIYDRTALRRLPERKDLPAYSKQEVKVPTLKKGNWEIEAWNTWEGKVINKWNAVHKEGEKKLGMFLPDFKGDIALKLKMQLSNQPSAAEKPEPEKTDNGENGS